MGAWIDQRFGGNAPERFLEFRAWQTEELRNVRRVAGADYIEQSNDQGPCGLSKEEVRAALAERISRVRKERCGERLGVHRFASRSKLRPGCPAGTADIERVQNQITTLGPEELWYILAFRIEHDRGFAARFDLP